MGKLRLKWFLGGSVMGFVAGAALTVALGTGAMLLAIRATGIQPNDVQIWFSPDGKVAAAYTVKGASRGTQDAASDLMKAVLVTVDTCVQEETEVLQQKSCRAMKLIYQRSMAQLMLHEMLEHSRAPSSRYRLQPDGTLEGVPPTIY